MEFKGKTLGTKIKHCIYFGVFEIIIILGYIYGAGEYMLIFLALLIIASGYVLFSKAFNTHYIIDSEEIRCVDKYGDDIGSIKWQDIELVGYLNYGRFMTKIIMFSTTDNPDLLGDKVCDAQTGIKLGRIYIDNQPLLIDEIKKYWAGAIIDKGKDICSK